MSKLYFCSALLWLDIFAHNEEYRFFLQYLYWRCMR